MPTEPERAQAAAQDDGFDRLTADAGIHHRAGRHRDAIDAYRQALQLRPQHAGVLHNLGALLAQANDQRAALAYFDAALTADPGYVSAHYNRAAVLESLGDRPGTIAGFARTAALDPGHYGSHRALAFCLLAEGQRGRALDHFARTYDLRRGDDRTGMAAKSLLGGNRTKLVHDAEQFRYLAQRQRGGDRFEMLAGTYEAAVARLPDGAGLWSVDDFDSLGDTYNTAIHIADAPEIPGGALGPRPDRAEIVARFKENGAGALYFDDLLNRRAFDVLERYLLESTIWHDFVHIEGFVAAYLEDGLACPLLLQIADELRRTFPELLAEHPLSQAWAFKAVAPGAAVDIHADDAAVSINFWMTPTDANLNPGRGGMSVCRTPPPADWDSKDYALSNDRAVSFFEQNCKTALVVPYSANRAALFESRLIHASDAPEFKNTYINHRINVSLLFGCAPSR